MEVPRKYWWVAVVVVPIVIAAIPIVPQFFASEDSPSMTKEEFVAAVIALRDDLANVPERASDTDRTESVSNGTPGGHVFSRFQPQVRPSRQLEALLSAFAADFESQKWLRLLDLFDPVHVNSQLDMYINDDFMFLHLGEPGQRSRDVVIKLYLYETLSLTAPDGPKVVDDVRAIYFTDMREDSSNFWKVSFTAERQSGKPVQGNITVDKNTLRFLGAWG